jgi:hypothetical protein
MPLTPLRTVTPFTSVKRRSAPIGGSDILTGRWVTINGSGLVVAPGSAAPDALYLALEGSQIHVGSPTDFGSSPYPSTNFNELPSVVASGQLALAYGQFIYEVGPEGCDPTHTFSVGDLVTSDAYGRLVAAGGGNQIGVIESVTTDTSAHVTLLRVRTLI